MNKTIKLSIEERANLLSQHRELRKVKGNANLAYRVNAILLLDDGLSIMEVARCLFLDDDSIRNYRDKYNSGADSELLGIAHCGRESNLSNAQLNELEGFVEGNIYQTVYPIIAYVSEKWGVTYSASGMTRLLHSLGFSYKKPKLVGAKANQAKQEEFIKAFEELYANSDLAKIAIAFADGVHPQHNTVKDYGWIKTSEDKYVKSNTGRTRVNILAAVDVDHQALTYCISNTINAETVLSLFRDLEAKNQDKDTVYFISDNAKYFHSKLVQEYLVQDGCKIKMMFLPTYSPNLNIIERLWSIMRKEVLSNTYYEKFVDFESSIMSFLSTCWTQFKDKLTSKLNYNFHKLPEHAYA